MSVSVNRPGVRGSACADAGRLPGGLIEAGPAAIRAKSIGGSQTWTDLTRHYLTGMGERSGGPSVMVPCAAKDAEIDPADDKGAAGKESDADGFVV